MIVLAACTAFAQDLPAPAGPPAPRFDGALGDTASGLALMSSDDQVPLKWLPPGAVGQGQDRGPSEAIFPPQRLTLHFNHNTHTKGQHLPCTACHDRARTSESVADILTPKAATCDSCHGTDHADLNAVRAATGAEAPTSCGFCHVGYRETDGNRVAKFELPRANMVFNHKAHAARNIGCQQCHGQVEELELATRDQMPRMLGCVRCHQHPDPDARGEAKATCDTCHLKSTAGDGGRIRTTFPSGTMHPQRWLRNAEHTPDFVQRHKYVAANDSQFCANCHKEDFCTNCHDGRVRPRSIHPNDYLSMHAIEGRLATQKCTSCHREQSFCLGCHQRTGVSMSGPVKDAGRFHPPKAEWSDPPRRPGHHSFEANRNLNACVSCHIERDCVTCHGGQGIGGGFNPHPGTFASGCGSLLRRNPRPCYVCHDPGAQALERCR